MYKVLCCGSRNWKNEEIVYDVLSELPKDTIILHGTTEGADIMAGEVAKKIGLSTENFVGVDESDLSDSANRAISMLNNNPVMILAFHEDISKSIGTKYIMHEARLRGIHLKLITC